MNIFSIYFHLIEVENETAKAQIVLIKFISDYSYYLICCDQSYSNGYLWKKSHRVWEVPKSYDVWGEIIQLIHFIVDSYATPLFKILNSKKFSNLVIHIICSRCQILLRNIWPSYTNWGKASPRILMFVICIISFTDHIQDTIFSYKITFPIPDSHYIQYINITYS